jgi:hypothetical protein
VDGAGRFAATFPQQYLPLEAFPLLEDPFLSLNDIVLSGVVATDEVFCGVVTGYAQVYGSSVSDRLDLAGTTFGAARIHGDAMPEAVTSCPPPSR